MANLITELEIKRFRGMEKAELPVGTILTPSARDWANEHRLKIIYTDSPAAEKSPEQYCESDKTLLLKRVVKSAVKRLQKAGTPVKKDQLIPVVISCLKRLGCKVKS